MLSKLLKYEFRATGRLYLPLYLVIIVFAVLGRLSINGSVWNVSSTITAYGGSFSVSPTGDNLVSQIIGIAAALALVIYVLAILGAFVVHFVITIQRFWKNLMGDEGYLMFTLPVSTDALLWSKAVTALVWGVVTSLVVVLSFFILAFQPWMLSEFAMLFRNASPEELAIASQVLHALFTPAFWIFFLAAIPVSGLGGLFLLYAAMAIGHTVRNHKVLASVGAYMGISVVTSMVTSSLSALILPMLNNNMEEFLTLELVNLQDVLRFTDYMGSFMNWSMGLGLLASVIIAAGTYFTARYLLNTQLNLE